MDLPLSRAERELPYLSALRRELHRCPELGLQEFRTAEIIERELDKLAVPHRRIGATGVLGALRGKGPGGKAAALRADIDGLPITEQNQSDYASLTPGNMHACGHDAHTAMLLGAVKLLSDWKEAWGGEIRFLFQPAEETGKGAQDFLDEGALEGVSGAFGLHVAPELPVGTVGIKPGPNNAAVEGFRIAVQGKSVHVSTPEQGVDALYIASHIVVALQAQVSRRTSPVEPIVLGIGAFHSGTAYNALAETALLEGTTRTCSEAARLRAREQVNATAEAVAKLYGGSARVEWEHIASALVNDGAATQKLAAAVKARCPELTVITGRPYSLSGDNFSEFQLRVPGVYAYLGTSDPARPETQYQIHSSRFEIDEAALPIGAWLYANAALTLLAEEETP